MKDLEEAVQKAQTALDITPEAHPDLPCQLTNLANRLGERYH
jgi:hypothetical protein